MWLERLAAAPWLARSAPIGRLLRRGLDRVPDGLRVPILTGPLRGAWWITGIGTRGYWLGTYEPEQVPVFTRVVKSGMVVYDLGANVGWYTLLAARLVGPTGRVVAFEPDPANVADLNRTLRLNRCTTATVIEAAVTDREGEAWLADGLRASSRTSWRVATEGKFRVRTRTLDGLVARGELPAPDVVKMDVEGAEGAVLDGAASLLAAKRTSWFVSTHGAEMHAACTARFEAAGYRITTIKPFHDWWGEFLAEPADGPSPAR